MYFKNEHSKLEILIGGYTDSPWRYSEEVGRNALECQASYGNDQTGKSFVMWDEIFQTDEIAEILSGLQTVLSGEKDDYEFKSQYKIFDISIRDENGFYPAEVNLHTFDDDIYEKFVLTQKELTELIEYLADCCEKYPIR